MTDLLDGTRVPAHGMFFMESAGGYRFKTDEVDDEERQASCFALEEEKGETWTGIGASRPIIIETKPTL